jgi:tetratricopeptide (TPR) repeat protein
MYNHAEAVTRLKHILTNEVEAEYSISSDLERASSPSAGRGSSVHRLAHSADHERLCRDLSSRLWGCWFEHPQDILCDNPAIMCLKFFEETGDQAMLDEILILERAALDMPPPGHSDQATSLATLSASLNRCFQHTGHRYLLQQAAKFEQEALHLSPLTDVERGCLLERLASALMKCFHETGEVEPLQMAVQINREALDLRARNNVDRALFLVNLTYPLKGHIALTGNQVLLDEAISLERETMRFMPPDHATRASLCTSLASLLWRRFHATNHIALLDEAMALEQEAIDRCSVDLSDRALSCGRLIDSILRRYGRMRESATLAREATLRKATAVAQEAIHLAPIGHPYRAWLRTSLLQCLHQSLKMTRATSVLDQIIVLEQEALSQRPRGHSERVLSCQILAGLLLSRFLGTGNIADVHQANMLDREAIDLARTNHRYELLPLFHPERASSCANLAVLLIQQFDQVGDVKLLEKAIALEREAMGLRPPGHTARAMSCGNLAFSLMKLFDQVGEITLLDEAITLEREARGLRPPGHVDRTISCDNLAVYLKRRFDRTGELTLLDEAIELQREAMDLCPSDYPGRALLYNNLAVSLGKHFDRTGNITQLHESISLHREAIVLRIPGDPDRILSCVNLAISLRRLFESTKSLVLLDEVIALEREAVGLRPPGHPDRAWLCWSLASSICRNAEAHNLELGGIDDITSSEVRSLLEEAVDMYPSRHPELWRCFQGAAELECLVSDWEAVLDNLHRTFNCSTHSDINAVLQCTAELIEKVDIDALSLGQKQKLLNIYGDAIGSMSLAASSALNPSTQLQNIFQGKALGSSAVMLSIQVHDLSKGVWLLENARGLIWTQMMQIRDVQLDNVPTTLAQKLQVLLDSVTPAPYSTRGNLPPEITHHTPFARLGQVQDVIRQIRSQPGFTDFMRGLDSEALFEGAAGNIVVMLVPHRRACHALLIAPTKEPLKSIKLNIGEESLWNLTLAGLNSPRRGGHAETDRSDTQRGVQFLAKPTVAHDRLAKLWRAVVKPIIIQLGLCVGTSICSVKYKAHKIL